MDARAQLVGQLLHILVLGFALWVAIEMFELRGPDPDVPRQVLDEPAKHELGPKGCAPLLRADSSASVIGRRASDVRPGAP